EIPDAPEMVPGQFTVGEGPLMTITGNLDGHSAAQDFVDAYLIYISDPVNFRASTRNAVTAGGVGDTRLFLFNGGRRGVTMDDDDPAGGSLQSVITGVYVPGPGYYTLAISGYDTVPQGSGLIWNNAPSNVERSPDGPGASSGLSGWAYGLAAGGPGPSYQIDLQGATFFQA